MNLRIKIIMKVIFESLTASTLTLKSFSWRLLNKILNSWKVVIEYVLTLKSLRLVVISPLRFYINLLWFWSISLNKIRLFIVWINENKFLSFIIIQYIIVLGFINFFLFTSIILFIFFSILKLLLSFLELEK